MSCLPEDLWARAKELTAEERHQDARLMESAAGYLEQFRDEIVPDYAGKLRIAVEALEEIQNRGYPPRDVGDAFDRLGQLNDRFAADKLAAADALSRICSLSSS